MSVSRRGRRHRPAKEARDVDRTHAYPPNAIPALDRRLHWLIAIGIVAMIPLGIAAEEMAKGPEREFVFSCHKALGLMILVLATWRLGRRLADGFPHPVNRYSLLERSLAHAVHGLLLAVTVLAPLSGIARIVGKGQALEIFGLTLLPAGAGNPLALAVARGVHSGPVLVLGLGLLIILHVVGALKHHVVDRDATLTRMVGRART
jgi:cytochrome b561